MFEDTKWEIRRGQVKDKRKGTDRHTAIYNTLHRKLKIEQNESYSTLG
jgi:hypothetical protein